MTQPNQAQDGRDERHRKHNRKRHHKLQPIACPLLTLTGLYLFITSFFLAKKSLPHKSSCDNHSAAELLQSPASIGLSAADIERLHVDGILSRVTSGGEVGNGCWMERRIDAAAFVVVDALRFDFARDHLPKSIGAKLHPQPPNNTLNEHNNNNNGTSPWASTSKSSQLFQFVADPPTVTMQRLKGCGCVAIDFARDHLPKSIGAKLHPPPPLNSNTLNNNEHNFNNKQTNGTSSWASTSRSSQLFQFVADPPTVTMQRLKGLTTGGLPTFADISGSFGGANVDEDNWVDLLKGTSALRRGWITTDDVTEKRMTDGGGAIDTTRIAFVGDDTWVDLYPHQFDDSHPYPSFNTRDLNSVDDGCLEHLPRLLKSLGRKQQHKRTPNDEQPTTNDDALEVMVVHFLGVDHVGHTYGPNNPHMTQKLAQMDEALSTILDTIDATPPDQCHAVFVLGDHGMTEDGNHGGGTEEETNAALFTHFSEGCNMDVSVALNLSGSEIGKHAEEAFQSIHQIDLVPTLSILLGLPIPYANIGGIVPSLLPPSHLIGGNPKKDHANDSEGNINGSNDNQEIPAVAAALALNAAQVWRYLSTYSDEANALPVGDMTALREILGSAATVYRSALSHPDANDSNEYRKACGLFKIFLNEAVTMGKRVWTRFDTFGMACGIGIVVLSALIALYSVLRSNNNLNNDYHLGVTNIIDRNNKTLVRDRYTKSKLAASNNTGVRNTIRYNWGRILELSITAIMVVFHCIVLTFSNSYIESEQQIIMFFYSILCITFSYRWMLIDASSHKNQDRTFGATLSDSSVGAPQLLIALPIIMTICARINDCLVSGHGLDPSIRLHSTHSALVFLPCLALLGLARLVISSLLADNSPRENNLINHALLRTSSFYDCFSDIDMQSDLFTLILLSFAWWEKRSIDQSRNGYTLSLLAMIIPMLGIARRLGISILYQYNWTRKRKSRHRTSADNAVVSKSVTNATAESRNDVSSIKRKESAANNIILIAFKFLLLIMLVTGPSAAASGLLLVIQYWATHTLSTSHNGKIPSPSMAAIWRFSIRHAFFASGHACSFNRLQFSAAFVTTETFEFIRAGTSLFLNTFGWEVLGLFLIW
eukprot:CAMPEP_0194397614 /NCGR_PEP_ID=MMETSP0174-20130528/125643_1 /TAXON_ID=216777 /ORGANISM="Proboscia alata, Strain PI-D3" /LENGTH=1105 /DNA_ID=CAMNT_0039193813 /DNA_START=222 /DNA_END=3537 /DNA_ORIENTATION=-